MTGGAAEASDNEENAEKIAEGGEPGKGRQRAARQQAERS